MVSKLEFLGGLGTWVQVFPACICLPFSLASLRCALFGSMYGYLHLHVQDKVVHEGKWIA